MRLALVIDAARSKIQTSPIAMRLLRGAIWSVAGAIVSNGLTLLLTMLVARTLGREQYGQFIIIQSSLGTVGVLAGFGIGTAATRYVAELKTRDPLRLSRILALAERIVIAFGVISTIALVIFSNTIAERVLAQPSIGTLLTLSSGAVIFSAIDGYQKGTLIGFEAMRAFAAGTIASALLAIPIMLVATQLYGINGAATALSAIALLQAGVSRYQMVREMHAKGICRYAKNLLSETSVLWTFALPALLAGALVGPAHWAAQAMLANTNNGYSEVAVLGIAMQWLNVIIFLPATAGRTILPMLTDYLASPDQKGSRYILLLAMAANTVVAVPLAAIVVLLAPAITGYYGSEFTHSATPVTVAAIIGGVVAIHLPFGQVLSAANKMWTATLTNGLWCIVYLIAAAALVERGATGILLALLLAYALHSVWTVWLALSLTPQKST